MTRKYEDSHPWLTFGVDLRHAPFSFWVLLGEARSKLEHLAGVPLRPDAAQELHRLYLAKGAWATTAIEGNTLSEEQVRARIEGSLKLPPSQEYLGQEIDNIVAAVNEIARRLFEDGPAPLTPEMISEFNEMVLRDLELDPEVVPGEFRQYSVAAGPYVGAPAEDIPHLVARLCDWLQAEFEPPADHPDMVMAYVIIKAVIAHLYFEWIHPFGDGNGRTGRLVEFQILVSSGVPSPAAHLLSNHYNLTRSAYYRELNLASRSGGDVIPFVCYAAEGFVDGLREQIGRVQAMQMDVAWENYVHSVLDDESSPTTRRRRTLVLELSRATKLVPRSDLLELTGRVAEAYAGKTGKTLTRDLNALLKLGLLLRVPDGYEANKDMMRAFLAAKVQSSQVTEPGQDRRGGQLP
jgi:Fic family protein